jgi:hypothetical protein
MEKQKTPKISPNWISARESRGSMEIVELVFVEYCGHKKQQPWHTRHTRA